MKTAIHTKKTFKSTAFFASIAIVISLSACSHKGPKDTNDGTGTIMNDGTSGHTSDTVLNSREAIIGDTLK